jgi:hypothetical protein
MCSIFAMRCLASGAAGSGVATVPSHLSIPEVRSCMTVAAAEDLAAANTAALTAADERGRSAQTFTVDVLVRSSENQRRVAAIGQDIYAISAPGGRQTLTATAAANTCRARRQG